MIFMILFQEGLFHFKYMGMNKSDTYLFLFVEIYFIYFDNIYLVIK